MQFTFLSRINSKIHRLKGTTIIQFGPPRSGTTLIYNILKDIFLDRFVETRHYYRDKDKKFPTVVTYRNPLDSILSHIMIAKRHKIRNFNTESLKKNIHNSLIDTAIKTFEGNGINDIVKLKNNNNVLMLKYEKFFNNFEYIYQKLEIFFNKEIDINTRNVIKKTYGIDSVDKITKQYKSYSEIDSNTLFHGDHININKGEPGFYKIYFREEQIEYLKNIYKNFITNFNYS